MDRLLEIKTTAALFLLVVACTSATDAENSTWTTEALGRGYPCASANGDIEGDTRAFVHTDSEEIVASLGWYDAPPCTGTSGGMHGDGFFADLEDTVLLVDTGTDLHVRAPGFDNARLEVHWRADGSTQGVRAPSTKVESGLWRVDTIPDEAGVYTLGIRFEYGKDGSATFAVMADVGG